MKVKISTEEIRRYLDIESPEFPKYVSPLINLANQYAQGTRPKVVGQMSELIHALNSDILKNIKIFAEYLNNKNLQQALGKLQQIKKSIKEQDATLNILIKN